MSTTKTSLRQVRKQMLEDLGHDAIAAIHRESWALDLATLLLAPAAFVGLIAGVATLPLGLPWVACVLLQGVVLHGIGLVNHDLLVHRRIFGDKSWLASILLTLPLPYSPTGYAQAHRLHHRHIGAELDTEAYKQDLNTRSRRLLFCTVVGLKLVMSGAWAKTQRARYMSLHTNDPVIHRHLMVERCLQLLVILLTLAAAVVWPWVVLPGYVLPALVLVPMMNGVRIILEHADLDPDNPFHIATFYRTSCITRLAFLWNSGDAHIVHHIYPNVPWYRIGAALKLLRPILLAHGVIERRCFAALLWGWFVANYPHRSLWPIDHICGPNARDSLRSRSNS